MTKPIKTTFKISLGLMAALSLSACGGGGGGSNSNQNPIPDYIDLNNSSLSADSTIAGSGVSGSGDIVEVAATLTHNTRALVASLNGISVLTDVDGDDQSTWNDGDVTISRNDISQVTYQFSGVFIYTDRTTGSEESYNMVIGVATDFGDVPTSGEATYSGEAFLTGVVSNGPGFEQVDEIGQSTIVVDFAAGTSGMVDVSIAGLGTNAFDRVDITGMEISGNSFSGGVIELSEAGQAVTATLLGAAPNGQSEGNFFGLDEVAGQPSEAGGVLYFEGASGVLGGGYIADLD